MEEDGQDDSKASKKEAFMSAREKLVSYCAPFTQKTFIWLAHSL